MSNTMELENTVSDLVDSISQKFYGKYKGIVADNEDPLNIARLKLKVPSLLGEDVTTGWAYPCLPYGGELNQGFLFVPEVESQVWVEFEEGNLHSPIWVGTYWSQPEGESEIPKPNDADGTEQSEAQSPVTRKIIKTSKGHTIQIEDADDEEMITIIEATNGNVITMNADGIHVIDGANQQEVNLHSDGITVTDKSGNEIDMSGQGIVCEDKNGNSITMDGSSGFFGDPGVKVNGGAGRVCMEELINWLMTHQHVGNMGAPTPLFPASMTELTLALSGANNILSKKIKVE